MRLGLFGGSFDPVHLGHLTLAGCCVSQAQLDQLWFVPAAQQPLKPDGPHATDRQRLDMLRLAVRETEDMDVSEIEIQRGGVSFTVETLEAVHREQPGSELFFLMGADSLADFPQWHQPKRICELATLLVVRRSGSAEPDFEVLKPFVSQKRLENIHSCQVEMPATPISSSEIRALVADGGQWRSMVPAQVAEYVRLNGVYLGD